MTTHDVARILGARRVADGRWIARCPAHSDRTPSLSIREAEDGKALIRCHAGCGTDAVLAAVGLDYADLWPETHWQRRLARRLAEGVHRGPRDEMEPARRTELVLRDFAGRRGREIENQILLRNKKIAQAERLLDRDRENEAGRTLLEEAYTGLAELEWLADLYRSHTPRDWLAARNWEAQRR